ncbi:MAG: hypothetical protein NXI01_01540 [Gammaproteobacteria bacterium]|nr:hypothetical protein [Gammaproteobacteria bacterium]
MNGNNEKFGLGYPKNPDATPLSRKIYKTLIESNLLVVLEAFSTRPKLSAIIAADIQNIQSIQILLKLTELRFLDALESDYFTIHDITHMMPAFYTYFLNSISKRRIHTGDKLIDTASDEDWASLMAEQEMSRFMAEIVDVSHLESLSTRQYTMTFLRTLAQKHGSIAPDLLDALDEGRVTMVQIETMSPEELETAIFENCYPNTNLKGPVASDEVPAPASYEMFTQNNRQIVLASFSADPKLSHITATDLANIYSSKVLLNLLTAPSMAALGNHDLTIAQIAAMFSALQHYFLALAPTREPTVNTFTNGPHDEKWAFLQAELATNSFMSDITQPTRIKSLRTGLYTMGFLSTHAQKHGPITPVLLNALDTKSIDMATIESRYQEP